MEKKVIVEETRERCTLCGGEGQEVAVGSTAMFQTCRRCHGSGSVVTKTVTRTEEFIVDVAPTLNGEA